MSVKTTTRRQIVSYIWRFSLMIQGRYLTIKLESSQQEGTEGKDVTTVPV